MEDLRRINDINYTPLKGDTVYLDNRYGCLLDDDFLQIIWSDNDEVQTWIGGWSSFIDNGGFILVGFSGTNRPAIAAILLYLIAYSFSTLGAFALLTLIREQAGESSSLIRWKGIGKKSPLVAALMSLFMLSFAGIPLTSGFTAKFGVFVAAISGGATPLVLVGVVSSVIAAVFYVRVIILMFFAEPIPDGPFVAIPSIFTTISITASAVVTVILGVFPQFVINMISSASVFLR